MTGSVGKPVRGPRWTQKRFVDMLVDCYGPSSRGPIDVAAVAAHVGVTPTTVRRWLKDDRGTPSRITAGLPRHRLPQLQRASEKVESRNEGRYLYALEAIDLVERGNIISPWQTQGWLAEHTVAVVEVHGKPWWQVAVTKANALAMMRLRGRGTILDTVAVPDRFHAQVLAHNVMLRQQNWRVCPAESQLSIGRTQVWMADAPAIDLTGMAAELGLVERR